MAYKYLSSEEGFYIEQRLAAGRAHPRYSKSTLST